jgi:hypothetical protein
MASSLDQPQTCSLCKVELHSNGQQKVQFLTMATQEWELSAH